MHTVKWFLQWYSERKNSSFLPILETFTGTITLGQNGAGSNDNEGVLDIAWKSRTGVSSLDTLVSYQGYMLRGFYSSAEMQSVYCTAPANWAEDDERK